MISPKILLSQQNRAFGITTSGYLVQRTFVFLFLYDVCGGGCVSRYGNCIGEKRFCMVDSGGKWPLPQQCCSLDLGFANAGGSYILDDARTWISLLRIATYPCVGVGIGLCIAKISSPQNIGPSCEVKSCSKSVISFDRR
jgi:hypothetical protein